MPIATDTPLPRTLRILQVYRGIAATLVVLYHLTWWGGAPTFFRLPFWTPMLPTWKTGGFFLFGHSGVDFFFTLSGFVMVWGYGADAGNVRRLVPFLRARFTRIYPTYWVVLALTLAFYWYRPGINDRALEDMPALWRGFWLVGTGPWQVPPAGTLPFELTLYAFFSLSFVLGPVLFAFAAAAWCAAIVAQWGGWYFFGIATILLSPQMLEFFAGAIAAVAVRRFEPHASGGWVAALAALCLVIGIADSVAVTIGWHQNVLTWLLPYALLLVVGAAWELKCRPRFWRPLLVLGDASFSIYLTHFYLIWEINGKLFQYPSVARTIGYDGQRIVVLVLVLAIGVAFWALVERPLLALLHRPRRGPDADAAPASRVAA